MKSLGYLGVFLFVAMQFSGCAGSRISGPGSRQWQQVIEFSQQKVWRSLESFGDSTLYPRSTGQDGRWKTVQPRDWTSGFFPGCLWYMSVLSKSCGGNDSLLKEAAMRWTEGLSSQQNLTQTHDIGFIIFDSFGKGYQLAGKTEYKPVILQAARSLMTRYNSTVGCIKSWDNRKWSYPVIIDNMMNLELLFWASKNGGTQAMYDAAVSHARKTMENHFRPDGSTFHVVAYDTVTGKVLSRVTHQGYADSSVWARGQAWAIYGFTMAYRETKDTMFLETAKRAADWFIDNLPKDNIPYWDFMARNIPNEPRDASAAAIAASGLWELSDFVDGSLRQKYIKAFEDILAELCSTRYLMESSASDGIVKHCVGNYPANSEIDVSLIYADYYFLESLFRYNLNSHNGVIGIPGRKD